MRQMFSCKVGTGTGQMTVILNKAMFSDSLITAALSFRHESQNFLHRRLFLNLDDQTRWFDNLDQSTDSPRNLFLEVTYIPEGMDDDEDNISPLGFFFLSDIDWLNRRADASWGIWCEASRGKGYGKALLTACTMFCFNELHLHRLNAEILEHNKASQVCAEHARWRKEGHKRDVIHGSNPTFEDGWIDSLVYGIIESDWYQ